jgi:hypothetical protein
MPKDFIANDAEHYIKQWESMNEEFLKEGLPFTINIPTIEQTQEWLKKDND